MYHASRTTSYIWTSRTLVVSCQPDIKYTRESRYTTLTASSIATGMSEARDHSLKRGSYTSTVACDRSLPDESTVYPPNTNSLPRTTCAVAASRPTSPGTFGSSRQRPPVALQAAARRVIPDQRLVLSRPRTAKIHGSPSIMPLATAALVTGKGSAGTTCAPARAASTTTAAPMTLRLTIRRAEIAADARKCNRMVGSSR